jgi:hypothetical protein
MPSRDRTVLVLGAGASLAEAVSRRPRRSRDHPPLDATFFSSAARCRSSGLLDSVEAQARRLGEPALTVAAQPVSLEAHLGRLYFEMNHNPLRVSTLAYFEAVDLYAHEITLTTNWMMGKAGLIKKMIQAELKAGRDVAVVTFNVDLLVENALNLLITARPGAPWCLNHAYGFSRSKTPVDIAGRAYASKFDYNGSEAAIPLFKMHGSTNWVFQHRDRYPPPDLVSKPREFYVVVNERLPDSRIRVRTTKSGRHWYTSPLLVPPVYEKHGLIKRHLQEVWDGASDALRQATRVVFWGYSFPQADMHARHYFQGLAQENEALRSPVLVNPDPGAASALWSVLRPDRLEHFRSAQHYLEVLDR